MPDGALDWMGVAHLLDVPGADARFAGAGPRRPLLRDDDVVLLGRDPAQSTDAERELVAARALSAIDVAALAADPRGRRAGAASGDRRRPAVPRPLRRRRDRLLRRAALGEHRPGHRRALRHRARRLEALAADDAPLAVTVTELNPHHGAPDGSDVARLATALARAIG